MFAWPSPTEAKSSKGESSWVKVCGYALDGAIRAEGGLGGGNGGAVWAGTGFDDLEARWAGGL
jgi:hypothetical protein